MKELICFLGTLKQNTPANMLVPLLPVLLPT